VTQLSPAPASDSGAFEMVVKFDLSEDGDGLTRESISELQRQQAPPHCEGTFGASRVLLLADAEDFDRHGAVVRRLRVGGSVDRIICVLRGRPTSEPASGPEVVLPPHLHGQGVAVMWVGDPRGVVWEVGTGRARRLTISRDDPDGLGSLVALLDVLQIPTVFDEVFDAVLDVDAGGAPVSPALRVIVPGSSDPGVVDHAEIAALQALAGQGESDLRRTRREQASTHPRIFDPQAPAAEFFTPAGSIGTRKTNVERVTGDALAEIDGLRDALRSRRRRMSVAQAILRVPDALADLRGELIELFQRFEPTDGINDVEWDLIARAGVTDKVYEAFREQQEVGHKEEDAVKAHTEEALASTRALGPIASYLRELARKATPRTSDETVKAVERACPREKLDALGEAPPFALPSTAMSMAALLGFGCTSVWWPGIWHVIPLLLLLGVAGWFGHAASDRTWSGWRAFIGGLGRTLQSLGFIARASAFVSGLVIGGTVIDGVAGPSAIAGEDGVPGLRAAGVVLSVTLLYLYARVTWRAAVDAWIEEWDVQSVTAGAHDALNRSNGKDDEALLDGLLRTARDVIGNDWLSADIRREFKTTVERLVHALELVRGELVELDRVRKDERHRVVSGVPVPATNPAIRVEIEPETSRAIDDFERLVLDDYLDEIRRALTDAWPLLCSRAAEGAEQRMLDSLREWQPRYSTMLREFGLLGEGPRFEQATRNILDEAGYARRHRLLEELWRSVPLDMLYDEDDLVQFCRAEDLVLLDQSEQIYNVLRFAPEREDLPRGVVQTRDMRMAGLMRVVPLAPAGWRYGGRVRPVDAA
jgi:hypothetical protein